MYICNICNKQFNMKIVYDRHMNRKTPCIKEQIKCKLCDRLFISLLSLQRHLNKKNHVIIIISIHVLIAINNTLLCVIIINILVFMLIIIY